MMNRFAVSTSRLMFAADASAAPRAVHRAGPAT
jgi:hypothetical protein